MEPSTDTDVQVAFPLPKSLDTKIHLRLSVKAKVIVVYLTTVSADDVGKPVPLGSLVYALPNVSCAYSCLLILVAANLPALWWLTECQKYNASQPLSTTIYHVEATVEFTIRLAKVLARKTALPVYVANSISLMSTGLGGTVEEEMEAFKQVVAVVTQHLRDVGIAHAPNGISA